MNRSSLWCLAILSAMSLCGCRADFEPPVSLEGWYEDLRWCGPDCRRPPYSCPRCPYYVYPNQRHMGHGGAGPAGCPDCQAPPVPLAEEWETVVVEPGPQPDAAED